MFTDAEVGDKVWSLQWGHGEIRENRDSGLYRPIQVKFEKTITSYQSDGTKGMYDKPSLFWQEFKIPDSAYVKPGRETTKPAKTKEELLKTILDAKLALQQAFIDSEGLDYLHQDTAYFTFLGETTLFNFLRNTEREYAVEKRKNRGEKP